jgi:hypothetical protein
MGSESATIHSFNCLMDLAFTYAKSRHYGMARDCALRAANVATRMEHPVAHMNALGALALISAAVVASGTPVAAKGARS